MTAGDKGVAIVINAGGFVLTGSTCSLIAAPGNLTRPNPYPPASAIELTGVNVQPSGLSAVYLTTGQDFLTGGPWTFWLKVVTTGGQTFMSAPAVRYVNTNPLLAA